MILTALLCCSGLLSGNPSPIPAPGNTSEVTAEGIEILRRILSDSLDDAFASQDEDAAGRFSFRTQPEIHGLVTTLWAGEQTVQHARGFHVPGLGAVFALDVSLPVVTKERRHDPDEPEAKKDDEWEATRRAVRGNPSGVGLGPRERVLNAPEDVEIDPQAIERVTELVIRSLARHATRIEGLGAGDSFTVALHISGKGHKFFSNLEPRQFSEEDSQDLEYQSARTLLLSTGMGVPEQHLTVRVSLADLTGQAEASYERLKARAQVNRY